MQGELMVANPSRSEGGLGPGGYHPFISLAALGFRSKGMH